MRMRHAAMVAGLALGLMSGTAKASYIIDIFQQGPNVVVQGQGELNIDGLSSASIGAYSSYIDPHVTNISLAVNANEGDYYTGIVGPSAIGPGFAVGPNSGTGNYFALYVNYNVFGVPYGYVSGTPLGETSLTFDNTTISALGITPSIYTYDLETSASIITDTIVVNVSASPLSTVPLPASAPMFGAALMALGAAGYGLKRKSKVAAAA